jgi:hypothetical protein
MLEPVGALESAVSRVALASSDQDDRILRTTEFPQYVYYYRDGRKNANRQQCQSCGLPLVLVEPGGQKKANTNAKGNPSSGHYPDLWDGEVNLFHAVIMIQAGRYRNEEPSIT